MRQRFRFEKLEVWQEARRLKRSVYGAARAFPEKERYGLISQLCRASVSVASNIAEGAGRNSDRDFAHFLEQAYGSLMETCSLIFLALDEGYLSEQEADALLDHAELVARQLVALNRSLAVPVSKTPFPRSPPGTRSPADAPRPSSLDSRPASRPSTLDPRPAS